MTSRYEPFSWSRLLFNRTIKNPRTPLLFSRKISTFQQSSLPPSKPLPNANAYSKPTPSFSRKISYLQHFVSNRVPKHSLFTINHFCTTSSYGREAQDLLAELEREKERERNARKRAGLDTKDIDAEDEEDYMGVGPLIEKLENEKLKDTPYLLRREEPSDSDSDEDSNEEVNKRRSDALLEMKLKRHEELIQNFTDADTLDEAFKWMKRIDKFGQKHLAPSLEYRVIGELMNTLKVAEGKEKFILQQKLNRAVRLVEWKEAYDPSNPANYGVIQHQQVGPNVNAVESSNEFEKDERMTEMRTDEVSHDDDKEERTTEGGIDDVSDDDDNLYNIDDTKERDDILLEKLNAIDKKLEEKLAELDHTFGKKGKLLEEEIRDLAEERNSLMEKKRRPLYRKVSYFIILLGLLGYIMF